MKAKFAVGDKVIFDQGLLARCVNADRYVEAFVVHVSTMTCSNVEMTSPVYQIVFGTRGKATVHEHELNPPDRDMEVS